MHGRLIHHVGIFVAEGLAQDPQFFSRPFSVLCRDLTLPCIFRFSGGLAGFWGHLILSVWDRPLGNNTSIGYARLAFIFIGEESLSLI